MSAGTSGAPDDAGPTIHVYYDDAELAAILAEDPTREVIHAAELARKLGWE